MTLIQACLGFALLAALLTIVPGADTVLVLHTAIARGRAPALLAGAGVVSGCLVWGVATAIGASAVISAWPAAYRGLRIAGALYIAWLGVQLFASMRVRRDAGAPVLDTERAGSSRGFWWRGFTVNLLNPKVGVFYLSTIPQFLVPGLPDAVVGSLLALIHGVEGMVWFGLVVGPVTWARSWFENERVRRWLDGGAAVILIGFAVVMLVEAVGP